MELKYSEILRNNAALSRSLPQDKYEIAVLSNTVIFQLKEILEYTLRVENIPAVVTLGDYDNIVQDSLKFAGANLVMIFWEPCNIVEGLQFRIELFEPGQIDEVFEMTRAGIDLVFKNLKNTSLVLFNTFTGALFSDSGIRGSNLDRLSLRLNNYVRENAPSNVKLVDLERVVAHVGIAACVDRRCFHLSKAPYTIDFFKVYSRQVKPFVMAATGRRKKVIIFDCDNTLWKGVLGEDGHEGIEMSSATKDGAVFAEVQCLALCLAKQGVLIGLCSKNNAGDVDDVIRSHPDMQLRDEHIAARRINWTDKVSNLRELARELNLGLDSFVMVDDSSFEANLIQEQLKEVTVLQVPAALYHYPQMLRENFGLFYSLSSTEEDARKTGMYKDQSKREASKQEFADIKSYLSSLRIKVTVYQNDRSIIARMAQLSQKTNQFNLTTRRYTERDIETFLEDERIMVLAFSVSDRFGDNGITGLCIVRINDNDSAFIDSFLMSCRVIGRDVEYAFMDRLVTSLKDRKIDRVGSQYIKTEKNSQVMDFFERCSFTPVDSTNSERSYALNIQDYKPRQIDYVEIIDGRSNQECYGRSF